MGVENAYPISFSTYQLLDLSASRLISFSAYQLLDLSIAQINQLCNQTQGEESERRN